MLKMRTNVMEFGRFTAAQQIPERDRKITCLCSTGRGNAIEERDRYSLNVLIPGTLRKACQVAATIRAKFYLNACLRGRNRPVFPIFKEETRASLVRDSESNKSLENRAAATDLIILAPASWHSPWAAWR